MLLYTIGSASDSGGSASAKTVRAPFDQGVIDGYLSIDNVLHINLAAWLNNTGLPIHNGSDHPNSFQFRGASAPRRWPAAGRNGRTQSRRVIATIFTGRAFCVAARGAQRTRFAHEARVIGSARGNRCASLHSVQKCLPAA